MYTEHNSLVNQVITEKNNPILHSNLKPTVGVLFIYIKSSQIFYLMHLYIYIYIYKDGWLVDCVLWYIDLCRLFNAKSILCK